MAEPEVLKTCRACGTQLTHKRRYKDRHGAYLCPKCFRAKRRGYRQIIRRLTTGKALRIAIYVILAMVACAIFWMILDAAGQPSLQQEN
jgi:hypothetical protein